MVSRRAHNPCNLGDSSAPPATTYAGPMDSVLLYLLIFLTPVFIMLGVLIVQLWKVGRRR